MKLIRRTAFVALGGAAALVLSAGPGLAHECVNASKSDQSAGVQVIVDLTTGQRACLFTHHQRQHILHRVPRLAAATYRILPSLAPMTSTLKMRDSL